MYLDRCQVDTPSTLVGAAWKHVQDLRKDIHTVIDFGAGDGRFAFRGKYKRYIGYEIDPSRSENNLLPRNAKILNQCAFERPIKNADLCIGNPPFVRNQDLPLGWRQRVSALLARRTGVDLSGLANAWQYFFLLSLISAKHNGLIALIIPFEWVTRPAARKLREYIIKKKWNVNVYRLVDTTFDSVLTTSSITIVDKSKSDGEWSYFAETAEGNYIPLPSPSGDRKGIIPYSSRKGRGKGGPRAMRGLSPGTQKVLTLTEGERVRAGLRRRTDVVPCVTTLRHLPPKIKRLDEKSFNEFYRDTGHKCWLIRTDRKPSKRLHGYLKKVDSAEYQTSTCLERDTWWKFNMPPIPNVLMSMCFRNQLFPKGVRNGIGARAVGGVCGIYGIKKGDVSRIVNGFGDMDIRRRVVAYSNGLRKLEINQLNTLLNEAFPVAK